jgi:ParB-like chromosome segregation protein Spo0J
MLDIIERLRNLQIQIWPVDRLLPYVRNARTHTDEQVAQVAASMRQFGWTNPILVGSDNIIIAGHARLAAARKLGLAEVPVIVLDHLSEADRRALVLADNKIATNAGMGRRDAARRIGVAEGRRLRPGLVGFSREELDAILVDPERAPA